MDPTTLGRNILPLQRDDLVAVARGTGDHRSKELHLTDVGLERLDKVRPYWAEAQAAFDTAFGGRQESELRTLMRVANADASRYVNRACGLKTIENFRTARLADSTLQYPNPTLQYSPSLPLDSLKAS
jgi:hypothetical protein